MEFLSKPISIRTSEKINTQMKKAVCKILIPNQAQNLMYPGFLCKIPFKSTFLSVLITTYDILDLITKNDNKFIIKFFEMNFKNIKLDSSRKIFKDEDSGLLIIEIKSDESQNNHFFELNDDLLKKEDSNKEEKNISYNNQYVYIISYLKGDISVSYGKISDTQKIIDNKIEFLNSPSIIISLDTYKTIGIQSQKFLYLGYSLIDYFLKIENTPTSEVQIKEQNELILEYRRGDCKLFNRNFYNNNKDKCILLINEKEIELKMYYSFGDNAKIKLVEKEPITDFSYMFLDCDLRSIDFSKWKSNDITNLSYMFSECRSLLYVKNISNINIHKVDDISSMFNECDSLKEITGITNWNTSNVTNMSCLFRYCGQLQSLPDISNWDTSKVTDMSYMLYKCKSIEFLPEISYWNTSKVKNMSSMFYGCESLLFLPDISSWDISNVEKIGEMFFSCNTLESLPDISKWKTKNITDINSLFSQCKSLKYLPDISKWDTSKVTDMSRMFFQCSSLKQLPDISKWDISHVRYKNEMFEGCDLLRSFPDFSSRKKDSKRDNDDE